MKLTWLGHGCWLLDTGSARILVDPFFSTSQAMQQLGRSMKIDYILVTHGHSDHCADVQTVLKQNPQAVLIGCFELVNWFGRQGAKKIEAMNTGGKIRLPFGTVEMTYASHSSSMPDGSYGGIPCGFVVSVDGEKTRVQTGEQTREQQNMSCRIYFAGDTGVFSDMERIGRDGLAVAVVPIGDRFTMGPESSLEALRLLQPRFAIPSHYNTWPPIAQNVQQWGLNVEQITCGTTGEPIRPLIFQPGEQREI